MSTAYLAGAWNEYLLEVRAEPGIIRLAARTTRLGWGPARSLALCPVALNRHLMRADDAG